MIVLSCCEARYRPSTTLGEELHHSDATRSRECDNDRSCEVFECLQRVTE
jgi:hypothetical protein